MDGNQIVSCFADAFFNDMSRLTNHMDLVHIQVMAVAHLHEGVRQPRNMRSVIPAHSRVMETKRCLVEPRGHHADLPLHVCCKLSIRDVMPLQPGKKCGLGAVGECGFRQRALHNHALIRQMGEESQLRAAHVRIVVNMQSLRRPVDAQQVLAIYAVHGVLVLLDEFRIMQAKGMQCLSQQRVHRALLSSAARAATMPSTAAETMPPA